MSIELGKKQIPPIEKGLSVHSPNGDLPLFQLCQEILFSNSMQYDKAFADTKSQITAWTATGSTDSVRRERSQIPDNYRLNLAEAIFPNRQSNLPPHGMWSSQREGNKNQKRQKLIQSSKQLESLETRQMLFHSFANHELLALECFAWAYLNWHQDMSPRYQKNLFLTMVQEWEHFKLYTEKLQGMGCAFGELPYSDFFWKIIKQCRSHDAFMASMNLSFEQANLDYCQYYINLFNAMGDEESVSILNRVYHDEIAHVSFALKEIKSKSSLNSESLYLFHQEQISGRHGLNRALGPIFDRSGRKQAGLPLGYINKIAQTPRSLKTIRGVIAFNPEDEFPEKDPRRCNSRILELKKDMEGILALICSPHDDLVLSRPLSKGERQTLHYFGLPLPTTQKAQTSRVAQNNYGWIWPKISQQTRWNDKSFAREIYLEFVNSQYLKNQAANALLFNPQSVPTSGISHQMKHIGYDSQSLPNCDGFYYAVGRAVELETIYATHPSSTLYAKPNKGCGGHQNFRIDCNSQNRAAFLNKFKIAKSKPSSNTEMKWLILPYFPFRIEFSLLTELTPEGKLKPFKMRMFYTNKKGNYRGHRLFEPASPYFEKRALLLLQQLGRYREAPQNESMNKNDHSESGIEKFSLQNSVSQLLPCIKEINNALHHTLEAKIHESFTEHNLLKQMPKPIPIGIDAMLIAEQHSNLWKYFPLSEINFRRTYGHMALELEKRIHPRSQAYTLIRRMPNNLKSTFGVISPAAFSAESNFPNRLVWECHNQDNSPRQRHRILRANYLLNKQDYAQNFFYHLHVSLPKSLRKIK